MSEPSGHLATRPSPCVRLPRLLTSLRSRPSTWLALAAAGLALALALRSSFKASPAPVLPLSRGVEAKIASELSDEGELVGDFPPLDELDELDDRDRLWPPDLDKPLCTPKIYVYDLPRELRLPDSTVSQCRWSAYNSELLLYQVLADPPSETLPVPPNHPHRTLYTSDPSEADFFLVPLFPACYLFDCWVKAGWTKTERCDVDASYVQPVMQHVREAFPYWNASSGADHLIFHPMDYVDGYYTETSRAAMNASSYLVTVGDLRPKPYGQHFRFYRDIVIPSSTHLLNSYYINPMDYLNEEGRPLAQLRGTQTPNRKLDILPTYPEIFLPSPTPPLKGFFPPLLSSLRRFSRLSSPSATVERDIFAIFRGGVGEPTDGEAYSLRIRSLFFPSASGNLSSSPYSSSIHHGFASLPGFDIAPSSDNLDYARRLARSKFGLAPPGYTLDTTRVYEYLAFGVVPVFVGSGPHAGQVMPFANDVDWDAFSVFVPRERAHETPRILREMSEEEYERKRRVVWEVGRKVVLEGREGNAWKLIARQLCRMKRIGLTPGPEIANN
ncbi:hypothetical protein JCM8097_005845 [Rhodosporidiobolus ruineniae]